MRISDWSSDVCSSDLARRAARRMAIPCKECATPHGAIWGATLRDGAVFAQRGVASRLLGMAKLRVCRLALRKNSLPSQARFIHGQALNRSARALRRLHRAGACADTCRPFSQKDRKRVVGGKGL